jgi:hypothetical protein
MTKRRNVKIALERVTRTDLMCAACGSFRTEWAIVPNPMVGGVEEAMVGVHTKCIDSLGVRFTRKTASKKDS